MKFAGKSFSEHWKIIKIPTAILVAWSLAGFIIAMVSFSLYSSIFNPLAAYILMAAVFSFVGWHTVKDHKGSIGLGAWSGALTGVVYGFVSGIISILMFYFVPQVIEMAIQQAMQTPGVSREQIEGMMKIGIFAGVIIGPLFTGLIGAGVSAIGAFIAKKV